MQQRKGNLTHCTGSDKHSTTFAMLNSVTAQTSFVKSLLSAWILLLDIAELLSLSVLCHSRQTVFQ